MYRLGEGRERGPRARGDPLAGKPSSWIWMASVGFVFCLFYVFSRETEIIIAQGSSVLRGGVFKNFHYPRPNSSSLLQKYNNKE